MAIEVRHDIPAGMTALAGALAGRGVAAERELESRRQAGRLAVQLDAQQTRQTQELSARRGMQMAQIEAQADRDKEAADTAYARTALAAGLEGKIQEQQFDNQMESLQEGARVKANQFEYQFTTKQRQEIAKFNDARQMINSNSAFSLEEREAALRAIDLQQAGITPSMVPADPDKPQFTKGREPGKTWRDEAGNWMVSPPDGSEPKLILRNNQTQEHFDRMHQQTMELKVMELRAKREADIAKMRMDLAKEEVGVRGPGGEITGETKLRYDRSQIDDIMERALGSQESAPAGEQDAAAKPKWEDKPRELIGWSRGIGAQRTKAEADLPEFVGLAQAFMRRVRSKVKSGGKISPDMSEAIQEAQAILSQYAAEEGS